MSLQYKRKYLKQIKFREIHKQNIIIICVGNYIIICELSAEKRFCILKMEIIEYNRRIKNEY